MESLVGETGNREAIWVNGEKSVIKTGIMAVVIGNADDKITEEKIKILYEKELKEEYKNQNSDKNFEVWKELKNVSDLTYRYKTISKEEKNKMREDYLERVIEDFIYYIQNYLNENYYFSKYLNSTDIKRTLREDLLYDLENVLKEFENGEIEDEDIKIEMRKVLRDWKVLNVLRPHPEYMNLPNVYNFISKMCAEQDDKKMLMDTYLESLPTSSPVVQQFAPAQIAPSKTRASFFTSALATLNIFVDDYVASMINEAEIDINKFNLEKTALFMILPDEKTTFYGLCSLFVNQAYTKLCEMADAKGGRLNIRHNFILDEFGNFSAIPNFGGFLTVGRRTRN